MDKPQRDLAACVRQLSRASLTLNDKKHMAIERGGSGDGGGSGEGTGLKVRYITLEHGEHRDATVYRFERGTRLQLIAGPSLLGRRVFLYTNYVPADADQDKEEAEFVRNQYSCLDWWRLPEPLDVPLGEQRGEQRDERRGESLGTGALITDTDACCELTLRRAGAYHYYFVYENAESQLGPQGSGWFGVWPEVRAGGAVRRVESLSCQTVLAKCLGPLARWEETLAVAHHAGYNMIHLTPVQELGLSGSCYSVSDRLRLDPRYGASATLADLDALLDKLRDRWQMSFVCDVVLNHTANETPWLVSEPTASYNCANSLHLRPAALLDAALAALSREVAAGRREGAGLPADIDDHRHLEAARRLIETEVVAALRLHEMYQCDVDDILRQFLVAARSRVPGTGVVEVRAGAEAEELRLVQDPQYRRLCATVDFDLALHIYNVYRTGCDEEEARLAACAAELRARLERLNEQAADVLAGHLRAALDNCLAGIRYERLQADGPRAPRVTSRRPLVPRYFTFPPESGSLAEAEAMIYGPKGALVMAHNGWVMDADPLQDFARHDDGRVYLRRELIAWADSVKLRYGDQPSDSPFLWAHMREYVELTAEMFDGLRLDNCHSTPLHVAEYMVDCARNVNPELFVVAELFTNSDHVDNIFVNRLGITALIRESMSAGNARELGRLVHRFGGTRPAGGALRGQRESARARTAPAMLLDLTHDNPALVDKRSVFDCVANAALVSAAGCAVGSTRGYDELVPHHIHVVDESRQYPAWGEGPGRVSLSYGMMAARRELNRLHRDLAAEGYSEIYVDQIDEDVVAVTRHHPQTRQSVVVVAWSAWHAPVADGAPPAPARALRFEGRLDGAVLLEATVRHVHHKSTGRPFESWGSFERDPQYVNGLTQYEVCVRRDVPLAQSAIFGGERREGGATELQWGSGFAPGCVAAVRVVPTASAAAALVSLRDAFSRPGPPPALAAALAALALPDLATVLYRCEAEERDATSGAAGVYVVPGHGPLVYAGLQGVVSVLEQGVGRDDLGHAVCDNLRAGDWLPEYCWRRLQRDSTLVAVANALRDVFHPLADLPRFLVPAYFAALCGRAHAAAVHATLQRMPPTVRRGPTTRALALTSVQLCARVPSAVLPPPSPALQPPYDPLVTLSAGLPHFSIGYMRCWGRDTFIALRGMLLLTGRYQEARAHILGFGACLRHGLIPNLLDGGPRARYNCRDALWWWLLAVKQYVCEAPGGDALLGEPVARLFPSDDAEPAPPGAADQPLHDLVQEALERHFQGVMFRERNAGRGIDAHMSDKGFNVQVGVDPDTGFPFGGNDANCGTWMDKMGSSEAAGTRGRPATPRDGSAVELVALAYAAVTWLALLHRAKRFPYAGVTRRRRDGSRISWTYAQWADRIRDNFERHFWVPSAPSATDARPDLVHRRAIYKDSHGASQPWADYQLRCNFLVAMVVASDLFDPRRAWLALDAAERLLLGPLGIKTLDPADWAYRGDYNNSNNSDDPAIAHGFNYHQGPEWVWPMGYYVRARLLYAHDNGRYSRTVAAAYVALAPHAAELERSPWHGLPELTNAAGAPCADSCRTQAWSSATALEALHDLEAARRARPLPAD